MKANASALRWKIYNPGELSVKRIYMVLVLLAMAFTVAACSQSNGGAMSEKEYAKVINQHLDELDDKLGQQTEMVQSRNYDAQAIKDFEDYLWDTSEAISALAPPKKFADDHKKILEMYRTYIKVAQAEMDYLTSRDSSKLKEASDSAMDAIGISEDLEYFNSHGQYRDK